MRSSGTIPGLNDHYDIFDQKIFISTREEGSSQELINSFKESGAIIKEFPMIKTLPVDLTENKKKILKGLDQFQWIIFTSANGVKYFFEFLKSTRLSENIQFAVIGKKTADILKKYGYTPNYISQGSHSEFFSKELQNLFNKTNPKVLLPTGFLASDIIEENLKNIAEVVRINLYQTVKPKTFDKQILEQILNDQYDIIFFYSPSAVNNFYEITKDFIDLKNIKAACIGPVTEKACISMGITPIFTAKKPDTKNLVIAAYNYLKNKKHKN